jgi:hypothetical protein
MNFFLYIRSFFITIMVIITLYYLILHITYYNIINEYKRVTNGTIKMDKRGRYVGDHYLSTDSFHNSDKHIHIWMEYEYGICCIKYIFKKYNNIHSKKRRISLMNSSTESTNQMIHDFKKFTDTII